MIKIGITGGIGSGKSVVSTIFATMNIPVFDADREAKRLSDSSPIIKEKLISNFGNEIYLDGKLNRRKLAEEIFNNSQKLKLVNNIIHPELKKAFEEWCMENKGEKIVMLEAAILYESGFNALMDKVIAVYAPENIRTERILKRDKTSLEQVKSRINSQLSDEKKRELADFVVINDNRKAIVPQILTILNRILQ